MPTRLVLVDVPKRGPWWKRLIKLAFFFTLCGATAAVFLYGFFYWQFADGLPDIPQVEEYRPPILTEVVTQDAVLAGEFYNERRKVVAYERIPKRLVQAFIASEDSGFFDHQGIDILGTTRATYRTLMKKVTGRGSVQGGSTLTQQTAKAVLISAEGYKLATERKGVAGLRRKIREALLAQRLESALTKEEILYLYLNNVYLGHHSYGVQSAAENYYRKDVKDLTLGEMALIAGLPQAPSAYSPFMRPEAAINRRKYVLRRMFDEGMITQAEHDQATAEKVSVFSVEDVFHGFAPYFTEEVRRNVVDRYGNKTLLNEGLKVFTTMDSEKQRAAQEAVLTNLLIVDKRQGFRGPVQQLDGQEARATFIARSTKAMGEEKLTLGRFYIGLVTAIAKDDLTAEVNVGGQLAKLPLLGMRWAREVNAEQYYPVAMINKVSAALKVGNVIVVKVVLKKDLIDDKEQYSEAADKAVPAEGVLVRLEQEPEPQAALVSIDPHRQYLVAMVGGYDFDANEYNRAFQACRQPGSCFKPIVYSAALEKLDWSEGTIIVDSPIVEHDPTNLNTWKPQNYSQEFLGEVTLRTALVNSMNIPAVKTFTAVANGMGDKNKQLGIRRFSEYVHALGFAYNDKATERAGYPTPINPDDSSALGSSCVKPLELAEVYAMFSRLGVKKPTYFLRKIEDRFGRTVEDHTAFDDAWASLQDRVAAGYARLYEPGVQVISAETGWILTDLMRGVVKEGTGAPAGRLGKPAAGKTGTTNDSYDAWFTGFTRDLVTTSWVGYDRSPHPLGKYETGGRAALPAWVNYMRVALDGRTQPEFAPPGNLDLVKLQIDNKTGKVATSKKGSSEMWFKRGTEPVDSALAPGQADPASFEMIR